MELLMHSLSAVGHAFMECIAVDLSWAVMLLGVGGRRNVVLPFGGAIDRWVPPLAAGPGLVIMRGSEVRAQELGGCCPGTGWRIQGECSPIRGTLQTEGVVPLQVPYIVYGTPAACTHQLQSNWLLQREGFHACRTRDLRGYHYPLTPTI
jgi:hypothetical protein